MGNFRFKQFVINQERCAMKVGTDGVLLGAWATGGKRVLDIGTGTGLISLMMAQRFADAHVVGIDLDHDACLQAQENVAASAFRSRVEIMLCRLQDFKLDENEEEKKFDSIVSNPPFFVDSLKNPDRQRSLARHTDSLPFHDLFVGVKRLLTAEGVFSAIVPTDVLDKFSSEACMAGFYMIRQCDVKTVEKKVPKRSLVAFSRHRKGNFEKCVECIKDNVGDKTPWYIKLTEDFYL